VRELDRLRYQQVRAAREAGASWEEIGAALGMSKQSAGEYFTRRVRSELAENAAKNVDLDDEEATELAVEEVRTVRRRSRASAGEGRRRRQRRGRERFCEQVARARSHPGLSRVNGRCGHHSLAARASRCRRSGTLVARWAAAW
jgi:hypothetical protein